MRERDIHDDVARRMNLKVARRQGAEMSVHFLLAKVARELLNHFLGEQFALFFFGANKVGATAQDLNGFVVKLPEEGILKAVPELVAGGHGIRERVESQHAQIFRRLNLRREVADYRGVFQVTPLGDGRHGEMMLDEQAQRMR